MKYAVMDIGSNSVRLMISGGGVSYKLSEITRLALGMGGGSIREEQADKTVSALSRFLSRAKEERADKIYCFATSAVRTANNGAEFTARIKRELGLTVDVLSEEDEAEAGCLGALSGKDGGVIDIGGGSTEIQVMLGGRRLYAKSVPVGAVRVTDACGQNEALADRFIKEKLARFGEIPKAAYTAIGGTAINLAAMLSELKEYDPKRTDGYIIERERLFGIKRRLYELTPAERAKLSGLQRGREEIIAAGAGILCAVMSLAGANSVTVSEKDNLEGYLKRKIKCQEEQTL